MSVGAQLTFGFGTVITATVVTGVVAVGALYATANEKDTVARDYADDLVRVENLRYRAEQVVAASRAYLLTGAAHYPDRFAAANAAFQASWQAVKASSGTEQHDLERVQEAWNAYLDAARAAADQRAEGDTAAEVSPYFETVVQPARRLLEERLDALVEDERADWAQAFERSRSSARRAGMLLALTTLFGIGSSVWLAVVLQRRLSDQFQRQQDAVAARDEVLAVVSHDLRNPLAAILLASSAATGDSNPKVSRALDRIHGAARRMNGIIDELLEAARLEGGRLAVSPQRCDVTPLIADALHLFEDQAASKSVRLESQLPEHAFALIDPERIGRVLTNLFGNALKFTPPGGQVTVRAEPEPSFLRVSVSDTGPGLSAEQQSHLFEKHWQARQQGAEGLGLGLYIVKGLVEAHGGSVTVESRLGAGSTFSIRVPVA